MGPGPQRHGAALEVITSRMRRIASQAESPIRIVGLCTSLANAKVGLLPPRLPCCEAGPAAGRGGQRLLWRCTASSDLPVRKP